MMSTQPERCTHPIKIVRAVSRIRPSYAYCSSCHWKHTLTKPRPLLHYSSETGVGTSWTQGEEYGKEGLQRLHDETSRFVWQKYRREAQPPPTLPKHLRPDD